jgi:hypothetical protein
LQVSVFALVRFTLGLAGLQPCGGLKRRSGQTSRFCTKLSGVLTVLYKV